MQPFVVLSNPGEWCVTFAWAETPDVYVGYRFVEGEATSGPPGDHRQQPRLTAPATLPLSRPSRSLGGGRRATWRESFDGQAVDNQREARLRFLVEDSGTARAEVMSPAAAVNRRFSFQPAADGVWLTLEVVAVEPVPGSYCLQQCLRFTGANNSAWRRDIAFAPFLSELDMQSMGNANGTLTYARRSNAWWRFPVQYTWLRTQASAISGDGEADHGLIVRETPSRQEAPIEYFERVAPGVSWDRLSAGLYWERTAALSNRHPADCLHAWVDVGPLEAGEERIVRGKFYYLEGDKDDLRARWRSDFGRSSEA